MIKDVLIVFSGLLAGYFIFHAIRSAIALKRLKDLAGRLDAINKVLKKDMAKTVRSLNSDQLDLLQTLIAADRLINTALIHAAGPQSYNNLMEAADKNGAVSAAMGFIVTTAALVELEKRERALRAVVA